MMKQNARCIAFEAPPELREKLINYAEAHLTSGSAVIRQVLKRFFDTQEQQEKSV